MNHATAIRVGRQDVDLALEGVDDKLDMLLRNPLNRLLHNMVAVLILDAFQDVDSELIYELSLLVSKNMFESL